MLTQSDRIWNIKATQLFHISINDSRKPVKFHKTSKKLTLEESAVTIPAKIFETKQRCPVTN